MSEKNLTEEWRAVKGYEGVYEVSSLGRIKRVKRGNHTRPGFILRKSVGARGYVKAALHYRSKARTFNIHRLVAIAFIKKVKGHKHVNHLDGDKTNNHVENLEWTTQSKNQIHAIRNGFCTNGRGLTDKQVIEIRRAKGTQAEIGKRYGISHTMVSNIVNRKSWKHI